MTKLEKYNYRKMQLEKIITHIDKELEKYTDDEKLQQLREEKSDIVWELNCVNKSIKILIGREDTYG